LIKKGPSWGLIIPTKNRYRFLQRQLQFYEHLSPHPVHVYVGDSSERRDDQTPRMFALAQNVELVYMHLPGMNETEAAYHMAQTAIEPYLTWCGDDDFMLTDVLDLGVRLLELEKYSEYQAVEGKTILFATWDDQIYGPMEAARLYPDLLFRLYRAETFRDALQVSIGKPCRPDPWAKKFPELAFPTTSGDRGRAFYNHIEQYRTLRLPNVHLFRQGHRGRVTSKQGPDPWRTRLGNRFRFLARSNQWLHSWHSDNLVSMRRPTSPYFETLRRVEGFLDNG